MITFIFPEKHVGGVQNLILNLTRQLYHEYSIRVKIVDYVDGYVVKKLEEDKVDFVFAEYDLVFKFIAFIKNEDTIILTGFNKRLLYKLKRQNINPKFIFWNVFPSAIGRINMLYGFFKLPYYYLNSTSLLLKMVIKKKALYFMSRNGIDFVSKTFDISIESQDGIFLPVPIQDIQPGSFSQDHSTALVKESAQICISYIGRSDIWKVMPLLSIIRDIIYCEKTDNVTLYIITNESHIFINYINKYFMNDNLPKIIYCTDLAGEVLSNFLVDNIDLNISMGTAALESSVLGIPTILVDASHNIYPNSYKYRWLYECKYYDLGNLLFKGDFNHTGHSFIEIYDATSDPRRNKIIAEKCYEYTICNHSIKGVTKIFIEAVKNTSAKIDDAIPYLLYFDIIGLASEIQSVFLSLLKIPIDKIKKF